MDKTIARLNIEHFRKNLVGEEDQSKRQTLLSLPAEEEAKLAALGDLAQAKNAQTAIPASV